MKHIILRGKYVKPLIDLIGEDIMFITLLSDGYINSLLKWYAHEKHPIKNTTVTLQLVVTKKEYQKLIVLIPLVDTPIEAFEMVYGEHFNDNTSNIDR